MKIYIACLMWCIFITLSVAGEEPQQIILGGFSLQQHKNIPHSWQPLTFDSIDEHTHYRLIQDGTRRVVKAESVKSASGLTKKIRFNPKKYPYISWRWKVNKPIPGSDASSKSGDDYAARIYVTFAYELENLPKDEQSKIKWYQFFNGKLPPLATLNYIWENKMHLGRIVNSPYTHRVKMIVMRNNHSELHQWYEEERNIYEDYKKAFGEEPREVTSIAIMTDTDNTRSEAETLYGDIIISKSPFVKNHVIEPNDE